MDGKRGAFSAGMEGPQLSLLMKWLSVHQSSLLTRVMILNEGAYVFTCVFVWKFFSVSVSLSVSVCLSVYQSTAACAYVFMIMLLFGNVFVLLHWKPLKTLFCISSSATQHSLCSMSTSVPQQSQWVQQFSLASQKKPAEQCLKTGISWVENTSTQLRLDRGEKMDKKNSQTLWNSFLNLA